MKVEELAVIKERAEKATIGPWILSPEVCGPEGQGVFNVEDFGCICEVGDPYPRGNNRPQENMEFIAHAREDVPKLVAEIERLRSVVWRISDYCDMSIEETYAFLDGEDDE